MPQTFGLKFLNSLLLKEWWKYCKYDGFLIENNVVKIIDQTKLPHQFVIKDLKTVKDSINAIKVMEVRGAPLIGATAAYGIVLAIILVCICLII